MSSITLLDKTTRFYIVAIIAYAGMWVVCFDN